MLSTYVHHLPPIQTTHTLKTFTNPSQIHRAKAEQAREKQLKDEMDAKRAKTKAARERKLERQNAKRQAILGEDEDEE